MNVERIRKLMLLTLSDNDAEAISALRTVQRSVDWHRFVETIGQPSQQQSNKVRYTRFGNRKESDVFSIYQDADGNWIFKF